MSEATKYLLIAIVVAFAVSALWWWLVDVLFTARTGKRASERIREREARANPLTVGFFRFQVISDLLMVVAWSVLLWAVRGRSSDELALPIAMITVSAAGLWDVNRRWRRQHSQTVQSSEAAT